MNATDDIRFDAADAFALSQYGVRLELLKLLYLINKERTK